MMRALGHALLELIRTWQRGGPPLIEPIMTWRRGGHALIESLTTRQRGSHALNEPITTRQCGGHTLIELMLVAGIAALLLGAAVPSLQALIAQQQLRTAVSDLFAAIDLARAQALARGSRVMLVPADAAGADWAQGWIVFVDRNGNQRPDPSDELIFQHGPVGGAIVIKSVFSSGHAAYYLAFNGAGRSSSASSSLAAHWGTLSLVQGKQTRHIIINMLGRARVCDPLVQVHTCSSAVDTN